MNQDELSKCINFFNDLNISVTDITTPEESAIGNKVVEVKYEYQGQSFKTRPLYYKEISSLSDVRDIDWLHKYFGEKVYWLDIAKHAWPKGSGESDLDSLVIGDMAEKDDHQFRSFLTQLANNKQSGYIQRITRDGRPGQYYHNLENNNHWHDLVLWIKESITCKGCLVDKKYYQHLVFNWDKGKRTSLNAGDPYKIVTDLNQNIQSIQNLMNFNRITSLLLYKKQIILQGPPGTGKTRLAKLIAEALTGNQFTRPNQLVKNTIKTFCSTVADISAARSNIQFKILGCNESGVRVQNSEGTENVAPYPEIIKMYDEEAWTKEGLIINGTQSYSAAVAKYIKLKWPQEKNLYYKIVQFHPSYTYEDFVRGIVAKPNEDGEGILYKAENKMLGDFAALAYNNYLSSKGKSQTHSVFQAKLNILLDNIRTKIEDGGEFLFGDKSRGRIIGIKEDGFLYNFPSRAEIRYKVLFSDLEKVFNIKQLIEKPIDLRDQEKAIGLTMRGKYPYYYMLLQQLIEIDVAAPPEEKEQLKNYVLIIDEINRANLSSVLGELIYALEYRDEEVDSMYEVDGSNKLLLPPNLYIIGTMNTADRSVGHIDYAVKRRFAFVEVLPEELTNTDNFKFDNQLFRDVSALFVADMYSRKPSVHLSSEFRPQDVWLGHSYFIQQQDVSMQVRLDYEIKPILKEYVKDGVLKTTALVDIDKLKPSIA